MFRANKKCHAGAHNNRRVCDTAIADTALASETRTFGCLPDELLARIIQFMCAADLYSLYRTSKFNILSGAVLSERRTFFTDLVCVQRSQPIAGVRLICRTQCVAACHPARLFELALTPDICVGALDEKRRWLGSARRRQ